MATPANGQGPKDQAARAAISRLLEDTRQRLVETGTRNRLVHVNRANTRGNVLNIVDCRSDGAYAMLSSDEILEFLAGRDASEERGITAFANTSRGSFDDERSSETKLHTRLGSDALQRKLLNIAREAKTVEEESGVNILYIAMGFLTWFEDDASSVPREAPLVLLPVELVRDARTSTYDVKMRDEDVMTNLPLLHRLRDDFGINLPELEIGEEWKPSDYFAEVEAVTAHCNRWKIDPDAMQLGFFSFSKLLMYLDLAVDAWPNDGLASHELTQGLLFEGFENEAPVFQPGDRLDEVLTPERLFHVVDADASQAKVIEEVRSGRSLVVQGPPGTGKSQTITNIIAAASREGKRVLFLAEKMAALSVVHDRLVKVGLGDICLELHSRSANKKTVLAELARTLAQASAVPDLPGDPAELRQARDRLNELAEVLHRPIGATGETPYSVIGRQSRFVGAGHPPPRLDAEALVTMTRKDEDELLVVIARYQEKVAADCLAIQHPFVGTRNLNLQPVDLARLPATLLQAQRAASAMATALRTPIEALETKAASALSTAAPLADLLERLDGLPSGTADVALAMLSSSDLSRLQDALQAGADWRTKYDAAESVFVETAFQHSLAALRGPLSAGAQSLLARWGGAYRGASRELGGLLRGPLPKSAPERIVLVDTLSAISSAKANWESDREYCSRILGDAWRGEKTDFVRLHAVAQWCERLRGARISSSTEAMLALARQPGAVAAMREALREAEPSCRSALQAVVGLLDLDLAVLDGADIDAVDLSTIAHRFGQMAEAPGRYSSWAQMARLRRSIEAAGLTALADRMHAGELDGDGAAVELQFARAERLWRLALESSPTLRDMGTTNRHDLVGTFADLERQRLSENVTTILAGHFAQVPQGALGEMKVIRGEIGKKRGHMAIRRLFEKAGTAIQRIKPVLLMSPISVAQFLTRGKFSFDLLVIDEASQVRPEEALGAIARAQQIVVVGDKKQLPPTSFFDRVVADEEDEHEGDDEDLGPDLLEGAAQLGTLESILTLCEARGLASRMLQWHYRSRDPSLIAVSNSEFYDDKLVLPPSPLQKDPAYGLCFSRVAGVYDKGGKRDNRKEGEAVVARVAEHARVNPTLSLGIATFSFAQRNLITELLELARRGDQTLDAFLREGQHEDVFVKNIENVQGDERDVMLVSVGYGPATPGGRLASMSFGPVNGEGGERRLNVLFTRARVRCEVFASFDPGDIDLSRTAKSGPRILKRFLEFAKSGRMDEYAPSGLDADTPFEQDVADVIRDCGFLADHQVGSAGFRIDIGVRHSDKPSTYLLAVECDGATYHSALWARERDRLRQEVLEHLGWRFHRIWSTDWFYTRQAEIARLRAALNAARDVADEPLHLQGANRHPSKSLQTPSTAPMQLQIPEVVERQMPVYQRCVIPLDSRQEPHEVSAPTLAKIVQKIVDAEGPIHDEEIARRVAACFGKERAGSRILDATRTALRYALTGSTDLRTDGPFWFTNAQADAPPVRDRGAESGATLKADSISTLEIDAALQIARTDNAGGEDADLIRTAARLMGFRRVGSDLQARIASRLERS
ncbi:MAG: DUF3320 domain-containing protein [Proteobacteria bacterium]|nr:DUF3320 domain-containing protein [Pseudomonadota bacterium]